MESFSLSHTQHPTVTWTIQRAISWKIDAYPLKNNILCWYPVGHTIVTWFEILHINAQDRARCLSKTECFGHFSSNCPPLEVQLPYFEQVCPHRGLLPVFHSAYGLPLEVFNFDNVLPSFFSIFKSPPSFADCHSISQIFHTQIPFFLLLQILVDLARCCFLFVLPLCLIIHVANRGVWFLPWHLLMFYDLVRWDKLICCVYYI